MLDLATARRWYADDLRLTAPVCQPIVVSAFAAVPRERFLGPPPWHLLPPGFGRVRWPAALTTSDPRDLYHNVLVAIDPARGLNNGEPRLWAYLYDQIGLLHGGRRIVHVGAGTGYYSAVLAEIAGPGGRVTAVEIDPDLAARAGANLEPWPQATAVAADGVNHDPGGEADVIVVNAGVTEPAPLWLDRLAVGGVLLVPITDGSGRGAFFLVQRPGGDSWTARAVSPTWIFACAGGRDPEVAERVRDAFARGWPAAPMTLRRDPENADGTCWLRGRTCWLARSGIGAA